MIGFAREYAERNVERMISVRRTPEKSQVYIFSERPAHHLAPPSTRDIASNAVAINPADQSVPPSSADRRPRPENHTGRTPQEETHLVDWDRQGRLTTRRTPVDRTKSSLRARG
ncbi:hypothetical protein Q5P01_000348 [Channa striata]|uniref:Uncharacterized protein n=1 Tax=Channa striata TaxID=64152 RepID=A0AA88IIR9_CHASR|nr:hypothetical protein Q5P01_000348 [Channa striata]